MVRPPGWSLLDTSMPSTLYPDGSADAWTAWAEAVPGRRPACAHPPPDDPESAKALRTKGMTMTPHSTAPPPATRQRLRDIHYPLATVPRNLRRHGSLAEILSLWSTVPGAQWRPRAPPVPGRARGFRPPVPDGQHDRGAHQARAD